MLRPWIPPFLPQITIIANNCRDIPPRLVKAVTIAAGHTKDYYTHFQWVSQQTLHIQNIFKIFQVLKGYYLRYLPRLFDAIWVETWETRADCAMEKDVTCKGKNGACNGTWNASEWLLLHTYIKVVIKVCPLENVFTIHVPMQCAISQRTPQYHRTLNIVGWVIAQKWVLVYDNMAHSRL